MPKGGEAVDAETGAKLPMVGGMTEPVRGKRTMFDLLPRFMLPACIDDAVVDRLEAVVDWEDSTAVMNSAGVSSWTEPSPSRTLRSPGGDMLGN